MEKELLGPYKLVLGLEIHLHLKTRHKMFCGDFADIYDSEPNTHVCPVCLGLPGALPVPNFEAVQKCQMLGLALGCVLNEDSKFDRKHYFYPDLPKGYQISQYKQPLCGEGSLDLDSGNVTMIERVHMEEDVAKSFHESKQTLIDFNKSGMPLAEIVTKPTFRNIGDAVDFSKKVQDIVRFLGIGDVDMEKGQMRLEVNISLRTAEMEERDELSKYRVEIKNINSFRYMEKAVRAEIVRQRALFERGETPVQENRGYDEDKDETISQRSKEDAHDYRYFPEPDIPPMHFAVDYIEDLKKKLPELPSARKTRLMTEFGLPLRLASILSAGGEMAMYEKFVSLVGSGLDPVEVANALVNKKDFREMNVEEIIKRFKEAKEKVVDTVEVEDYIKKVLENNPDTIASYKAGKITVIEFLVGQVMKESRGKADSSVVRELLKKFLDL